MWGHRPVIPGSPPHPSCGSWMTYVLPPTQTFVGHYQRHGGEGLTVWLLTGPTLHRVCMGLERGLPGAQLNLPAPLALFPPTLPLSNPCCLHSPSTLPPVCAPARFGAPSHGTHAGRAGSRSAVSGHTATALRHSYAKQASLPWDTWRTGLSLATSCSSR
jgi:hypothetical protein